MTEYNNAYWLEWNPLLSKICLSANMWDSMLHSKVFVLNSLHVCFVWYIFIYFTITNTQNSKVFLDAAKNLWNVRFGQILANKFRFGFNYNLQN